MSYFYYQIKGKKGPYDFSMSNWSFPPICSGRVEAVTKNEAKEKICIEYDKRFPTRVLKKDLDTNEFLLYIDEIKPGSHIEKLFQLQTCKKCGTTYYVIDKYNDYHSTNKSFDYCSSTCQNELRQIEAYLWNQDKNLSGTANPVIYKITNQSNGFVYIGKTTQVFTLRWYQHFFQHNGCKFHQAITESKVTDWQFEVIEIVQIPADTQSVAGIEQLICDRERHWINHYNSVQNGYNSI